MPRTKRPVKKTEKVIESSEKGIRNEVLKKFDKLVAEQIKKLEMKAEMEARSIELEFKILQRSIHPRYMQMTIGQVKKELYLREETNKRQTDKSDDGYMTENSSQGSGDGKKKVMAPPSARASSRRSRSADTTHSRDPRRPPTASKAPRRRSRSVYRTPAVNKTGMQYPPITPKVAPQTPVTLLRQPRQGEMVVSMQGSPIMATTYNSLQQDEKVNCDIQLSDGTVLSLKPRELRQSQAHIPFSLMDPDVLRQITTLRENLDKVVRLGQQRLH